MDVEFAAFSSLYSCEVAAQRGVLRFSLRHLEALYPDRFAIFELKKIDFLGRTSVTMVICLPYR